MATLTMVAAYDVREDDRRSKLAAALQSLGDRVQKSVFVIMIDDSELDKLKEWALGVINPKTDSFLMLRQCRPCWEDQIAVGQAKTPSPVLFWGVF